MTITSIILFGGAIWSLGLALIAAIKSSRSPARWAFAAGMVLFAAEACFLSFSLVADTPDRFARGQAFRYLVVGFLPGAWMLFAITFSRGNYGLYLRKWRMALIASCALPVIPLVGFGDIVTVSVDALRPKEQAVMTLGWPAKLLSGFLVAYAVLILMNLERTFRAAVGIMRWRVKFVILGLGLLF